MTAWTAAERRCGFPVDQGIMIVPQFVICHLSFAITYRLTCHLAPGLVTTLKCSVINQLSA